MEWPAEIVMCVTDRHRLGGAPLAGHIRALALGGLDLVQVREKDLLGRELLALVRDVLAATHGTATRVIVNGRPDVAAAAGAHGVQLPEEGLPVALVRSAFPALLIGASCHAPAGVERAVAAGADFVLLGPVFATPGKEARALGMERLAFACRSTSIPVLAVGGIDASTAPRALGAGARGVAAIRHFLEGEPGTAVRSLRTRERGPDAHAIYERAGPHFP